MCDRDEPDDRFNGKRSQRYRIWYEPFRRTNMIELKSVSKIFRADIVETFALRDFDLTIDRSEFVAITGHSGSGKTTLLNVAGLLEEFEIGRYRLDGQDVKALSDNERSHIRNRKIGFVFQTFNLIPNLNIYDNVDAPLHG